MTKPMPFFDHEKLRQVRAEFETKWTVQDREWLEKRTTCRCDSPVRGPSRMREVHCLRCGHRVRS